MSGNRTVEEIKAVLYVLLSHPFVERMIGTVRREYLDRILFWTRANLEEKLIGFQHYYYAHRTHEALAGGTPERQRNAGGSALNFNSYRWQRHCRGLYPVAA